MSLTTQSIGGTAPPAEPVWQLVGVVQALSMARSLDAVMTIVRSAARTLTGADGATFVLREGDRCYYADEDAIAPLWKGQRFPLSACISGWAMLHKSPAVVPDIYRDPRIPVDAYRPTFVKSLVMVPIRSSAPIGAIGTYWATTREPLPDQIRLLQALADTTSVAMENVQVYAELERRVDERTRELEATNRELEAFSYSVSHDLRAPVRHISGFADLLQRDAAATLTPRAQGYLDRIVTATARMHTLIEDLLGLSRVARAPISAQTIDLTAMAAQIVAGLRAGDSDRTVRTSIEEGLSVTGDPGLVRVVLENLLSNAWKYSAKRAVATIDVAGERQPDGRLAIAVRDNGAGFDMAYAHRLFAPFQRLHDEDSGFTGSGVGLATVQRIVHRHGGTISAESRPDQGATFRFILPDRRDPQSSSVRY
jgi:signal transduction histidine kinase